MKKETLNILADAISEVGVWQWWHAGDGCIQMEFGGVALYGRCTVGIDVTDLSGGQTGVSESQAHAGFDASAVRIRGNGVVGVGIVGAPDKIGKH